MMIPDNVKKALAALVEQGTDAETPEEQPAVEQETPAEEQAAEKEATEKAEEGRPAYLETDYAVKGFHLDVQVEPEQVVEAAQILDTEGFFIEAVTGVDWIAENQLEAVYDFNNFSNLCRIVIRTRVPRDNPEVPTICGIFPGANWHERETHDFFGIKYTGHPDLSPLLLPEDADFHPLLKDFKA